MGRLCRPPPLRVEAWPLAATQHHERRRSTIIQGTRPKAHHSFFFSSTEQQTYLQMCRGRGGGVVAWWSIRHKGRDIKELWQGVAITLLKRRRWKGSSWCTMVHAPRKSSLKSRRFFFLFILFMQIFLERSKTSKVPLEPSSDIKNHPLVRSPIIRKHDRICVKLLSSAALASKSILFLSTPFVGKIFDLL